MRSSYLGLVALAVAVSISASFLLQKRGHAKLRQASASIEQQEVEITALKKETQKFSNLIVQVTSSEALTREQMTDLLKLRNEVGKLRSKASEKSQLVMTNQQLRGRALQAQARLAAAQAAPNYWPKDHLVFAGYSDPESAIKTILAAMVSGNISRWRESCTPEAMENLEKEFKSSGLSESEREDKIKALGSMLVSASSGFHILEKTNPAPNEAVIYLSFDGEDAARKFELRRIGSEWKVYNVMESDRN